MDREATVERGEMEVTGGGRSARRLLLGRPLAATRTLSRASRPDLPTRRWLGKIEGRGGRPAPLPRTGQKGAAPELRPPGRPGGAHQTAGNRTATGAVAPRGPRGRGGARDRYLRW